MIYPGDSVTVDFVTTNQTTAALQDADSLPAGLLVRNGADTAVTVTVTNKATGRYKAAVTIPSTYAAGDEVQLFAAYTIDAVARGAVIWTATLNASTDYVAGTPTSGNLYATVAALKERMDITDTDDDTMLTAILTGVCRAIDTHCGQSFYQDNAASVRYYTAIDRETVFVDPLVSVTTLATDDDADRTYGTTWQTTDYDLQPANAASRERPYTWIEVAPDGDYCFPTRSRAVKLTAIWGWPAVPAQVSEAALLWGERLYKRKDAPFGVASFIEAGEMRLIKEIDPDVQTLLAPFRRMF